MTAMDLKDVLKAAKSRWTPVALEREEQDPFEEPRDAIEAFNAGFTPEWTLATMQSGVVALRKDEEFPDDLGAPLHLEGYEGEETRILRHLSGRGWRLTILREGEGAEFAAEDLAFLGAGETGEGPLKRLTHRRYWALDEDGLWRPVAARLRRVEE